MAYTYQDFLNAADSAGKLAGFSQSDLTSAKNNPEYGLKLLELQKSYDAAKTPMGQAAAQAEIDKFKDTNGLKSNVGTIQGTTGAVANSGMIVPQSDGFTYQNETAYQNLLNRATNPGSFAYDYETDPLYAAYAKQYRREGDRAAQNTLAQVSAQTGGMPSSWAVSAAQQAANYYASQLADKIPALREQAYNEYLNNYNMGLEGYNAIAQDRNTQYQQWLDEVNRRIDQERYYNELDQWEREFALQNERYKVADEQWLKEMGLQSEQWQKEFDAQSEQWQKNYEADMDQWKKSYELQLYNAGLTPATINKIMNGGTTSTSSSSSGSPKKKPSKSPEEEPAPPKGVSDAEYKKIEAGLATQPDSIKVYYVANNNDLSDAQKASLLTKYKLY